MMEAVLPSKAPVSGRPEPSAQIAKVTVWSAVTAVSHSSRAVMVPPPVGVVNGLAAAVPFHEASEKSPLVVLPKLGIGAP